MIITAFFLLLRPGEYTDSMSDATPFTLGDVQLFVGITQLDISSVLDSELHLARAVMLTFTKQKNGVENGVLHMGLSGDPMVCVVKAVPQRVCHLQSHNAPVSTPLLRVYTGVGRRTLPVTPALITKTLKDAVDFLGSKIGFKPDNVSAYSLCVAGTMALLVGKVDPDIIQIFGRW